jgi:putative acetyltransferase
VGKRIVQHLICDAKSSGFRWLRLETGPMEASAPARRLYERPGFRACGSFGNYRPSANSYFMTLSLDDRQAGS